MKDWARWYVLQHGLAVFPLRPNMKAAGGGVGIFSATRDLAQIDAWWDAEPTANIGVLGCLRIDIDPKKNGIENWKALTAQYGEIYTLKAKTPSGGMHYYLRAPDNITNSPGALPKGIDVRGATAGYTVGPPSYTTFIEKKQQEGFYEFIDPNVPIADCPQWLLTLLTALDHPPSHVDPHAPANSELRKDITEDQLSDLRNALMSPEMLRDWEKWSDIGYALLGLGEMGRELFFEYSAAQREAMPDKSTYETEEDWWRNHRNSTPRSDYRSVFSRAQTLGWKNPKSTDPSKLGFGMEPLPTGVTPAPLSSRKFEVRNGWDFANAPGIRWRVDKILPQQGMAMIYGPPAVGKSFLIIDLLMAIVRGKAYTDAQYAVEQAPVVYVLAEGAAGVKQRLRAYQQVNKLAADSPAINIIADAPNLFDNNDTDALIAAIVPTGARVAVVDTVHASMMGGDENSAKDMGVVLGNCRKLAAAMDGLVILVHHVGKDAERGERGSSSIRGAMETMIELTMEEGGVRVARVSKQKDGDSNTSWQFKLVSQPVAGPNGVEDSAIVAHVPVQAAVVEKKVDAPTKNVTTEEAILGLLQSQAELFEEKGISFEILIANILKLRPDLTPSKVAGTISKAINNGKFNYTGADDNIFGKREKKEDEEEEE